MTSRLFTVLLPFLLFTLVWGKDSIEDLFPSVVQSVFPTEELGILEATGIGQLPDGRIFVHTRDGDIFVFNSKTWEKIDKRFPAEVAQSVLDISNRLWVSGLGFFGWIDDNFNFHSISENHFPNQIDSQIAIPWIYQTGDWMHFGSNKSMFHFRPSDGTTKVTDFGGMFAAYHWITDGELYLSEKDRISKWEDGEFVHHLDWPHKYRAFTGWKYEDKEYYTHADLIFAYKEGELIETLDDPLSKFRGADRIKMEDYVATFTFGGIVKIHPDASLQGRFHPWFHTKIDGRTAYSYAYFGGDELWFLSALAIFRVDLSGKRKHLGLETGYNVTSAWDIETFKEEVFIASATGFRKWDREAKEFILLPENGPDFETDGVWNSGKQLLVSTWVELGSFDDAYTIEKSDGSYQVFAHAHRKGSYWVSFDESARLLDESLEVLEDIKGFKGKITSIIEHQNTLWVTTSGGKLLKANLEDPEPYFREHKIPEIAVDSDSTLQVFRLDDRLFLITGHSLWEFREHEFEAIELFETPDWYWDIPNFSSELGSPVLIQRHKTYEGCRIGKISVDANGTLIWKPHYLTIDAPEGSIRGLRALESIGENTIAIISQPGIELVDLAGFPSDPPSPEKPKVVRSKLEFHEDASPVSKGIYRYETGLPLSIQLHSEDNNHRDPIYFEGLLENRDEAPLRNLTGAFDYHGIRNGKQIFRATAVNAFGVRSEPLVHEISVIPPWYLSSIAYGSYILVFALIIYGAVQIQTRRLKLKSVELQKRVDEQTQELIMANQAKSIFVSNVSHEIRNPMNGLLGLAQTLKVGDVISEDILKRLRRPSLYLYRFLSNVLDFSKFESGGIRFNKTVFDPNELIDSIQAMFATEIEQRKLTFSADYRFTKAPFIVSSQEAIEMILINLVGNAVKYTPQGGEVRLAILNANGSLSISVSDTGVGIPKEEQKKIFKPFEQGKQRSLIHGEKGAGIGLSLVQNGVMQLDGKISLKSEPGNGSVFTIKLPVETQADSDYQGVMDEIRVTGRFLIVEDLEYNLKLFAEMLRGWGAETDEVMTGQKAIEHASHTPYDMIFMDFDLPDMDGSEATRRIRQLKEHRHTAIVGLSAYTDQEFIQKALSGGMDDFQFKPLNPQKIAECIVKYRPKLIEYSIKELSSQSAARSSLRRLKSMADRTESPLDVSLKNYQTTLYELKDELMSSDIGSDAFETVVHQLKGHSALINDQKAVSYWNEIHHASRQGDRMKVMDLMDDFKSVFHHIELQLGALKKLESDFQSMEASAS
jgi:signal transduction histidine kinase/CheY-like chemotaxis protein